MAQSNDDSMIVEQIKHAVSERAAADARLEALLSNLYDAFKIATDAAKGHFCKP